MKTEAGALRHRRAHGVEIMAVGPRRGHDRPRPHRLGHDRVHREGVLGEHHLIGGGHEGPGGQLQDLVRAISEREVIGRDGPRPDREVRREGLLQGVARAVRVTVQRSQRGPDRGQGQGAGAERVLVRGQLDGTRDAVLPLQLLDRLAGLIGLEAGHTGCGEGNEIAARGRVLRHRRRVRGGRTHYRTARG